MAHRLRIAGLLLITFAATACNAYVVGDSSAAGVQAITGNGAAISGCGFNAGLGHCEFPRTVDDEPDLIVAFVSWWDALAGDFAYADDHARFAQIAPVVWVELPPSFDLDEFSFPTEAQAEAFNDAVAADLGCVLQPWSIRDARPWMADGIHYEPFGAAVVAHRLGDLTAADACDEPGVTDWSVATEPLLAAVELGD